MAEPREYNPEFLYLTTIGHITGKPHEIEIWYVPHGNCYYLISGGRTDSHWVKNLLHNPHVTFWVQGQTYAGTGRAIDRAIETELSETIDGLMQAKYQWNDGLIVELCPE
jgi:deazaflavin-dependent oxidoreductase (nitroreductase family)